jgi:glycosyltransferase involved in cell wall biosynthesis
MPPPIGGATVLFKQLVDDLHDQSDVSIDLVNTARTDADAVFGNLTKALQVTAKVFTLMPRVDVVSFHGTIGGVCLYAPVLLLLAAIFKKPVVIRIFGGWIAHWHCQSNALVKWCFWHSVLRAQRVLLETKSAVEYFSKLAPGRIVRFPNSRRRICAPKVTLVGSSARRFIYVGQVREEKGVRFLISIEQDLAPGVSIDVYGPLLDDFTPQDFQGERVTYKGVIDGAKVVPLLTGYDALVMPTYCKTEGYPGVIIEAYLAGIPVIVTRIGAIPEIVDESGGVFVSPQSGAELSAAINQLADNSSEYVRLCHGASEIGQSFDSGRWTRTFIDICREVIANC